MLAMILKMMGLHSDKAVHSRAEAPVQDRPEWAEQHGTSANNRVDKPGSGRSAGSTNGRASSVRSQEVKAIPAKTKTASKATSTAPKSAAKPAKAVQGKPKVAAPVAKRATKKSPPAATKAVVKSVTAPQAAPKPAPRPAPSKPAVAVPVKPAVASKAAATIGTMQRNQPEGNTVSAETKQEPRIAPANTTPSPSGVPQRSGRPSSRLASLTVPSMAQSVASTAAKSSYAPLPDTPVIIPPLPSATRKDPKLANNWKTKPVDELTDAELLAMPDDQYMNDKQLAAFRLKLALLKRDILASAGATTEHLREDTVVVPDPADRATIEEEHALELRTRDRERKLLKKIEQSISRIDAGDYGYCDETGEPIGVGRLLARPTATLSLEAQQRRELKQKMFGD